MGIQRKSLTILLITAVTIATTAIVHSKRKLTDRTKDAVTTTAETAMTTAIAMITIAVIVMKIMVAIVMKITVAIVTTIVTMVITQKTENHIILISKRMKDIVNLTTITVTKATIVTKVITAMKVISKTDNYKKPFNKKPYNNTYKPQNNAPIDYPTVTPAEVRLNKYIADAGICSRRNADMYISSGNVTVNGEVMTTLGYRVKPTDEVRFDGKTPFF